MPLSQRMTDHTVVYMCPIQWSYVLLTMWFGLGGFAGGRSWETWVQSSEETRWQAGFWFVWIESQNSGLFDSEFGVKTEIWIWNQAGNQFLFSAAITIGCYCLVLLSVILCNMVLGFCFIVLLWIKDVLLCVILY